MFQGSNNLTKRLLSRLTARKKIYVIAGEVRGAVFIRFAVSSRLCESGDVAFAWHEIQEQAQTVLTQEHDDDLVVSDAVAQKSVEEELFIGKKSSDEDLIANIEKFHLCLNTAVQR